MSLAGPEGVLYYLINVEMTPDDCLMPEMLTE